MLPLPKLTASALIARRFSSLAFARASGASCMRRSRMVAWPSPLSPSAVARHRSCCAFMQVPTLSASLKVLVECASRRRAAPRSQFVGVAASGDTRAGQGCKRGRQILGPRRLLQPRCFSLSRFACGSEITAPWFAVKQRPNPSVNLTPCGSPRLAFISFWAKHGLPQGAGYLER